MPLRGDGKRAANRDRHQRKRLRQAGLTEQAQERKVLFPIRIEEGILGRIHRLTHEGIARGTHPWKTPSETVRALIRRGLESLRGEQEIVDEMIPYLHLNNQLAGIQSSRREAQVSAQRAKVEIEELLGIGAKQEALQLYHVTRAAAHDMPPTVWRDWMIDDLKRTFPQLDKQIAPGVTLATTPVPVEPTKPTPKSTLKRAMR